MAALGEDERRDFCSLIARACCFFRLGFSMCPGLAGAGKTHDELGAPCLRDSITDDARSGRGITRRAFSVLPCRTCPAHEHHPFDAILVPGEIALAHLRISLSRPPFNGGLIEYWRERLEKGAPVSAEVS